MAKTIRRRIEDLENKNDHLSIELPYVIVKDGEPIPEGVKAYSPLANPDLWDEDMSEVQHERKA